MDPESQPPPENPAAPAAAPGNNPPTFEQQVEAVVTNLSGQVLTLQSELASQRAKDLRPYKVAPADTFTGAPDHYGLKCTHFFAYLEVFFSANAVPEDKRVYHAVNHLRDAAALWWTELGHQGLQPTTWGGFKQELRARFSASDSEQTIRGRLSRLRQVASVQAYAAEFLSLATQAPNLADNELRAIYTFGLKETVRIFTAMRSPTTLRDTVAASIDVDNILFVSTGRGQSSLLHGGRHSQHRQPSGRPHGSSYSNSSHTYASAAANGPVPMELGTVSAAPLPPLTAAEREHLRRIGGCFRCRNPGHIASQCPAGSAAAPNTGRDGGRRYPPSRSGAAPVRR